MADQENLPNPSDRPPDTEEGAEQRREIENIMPAGPAVPAPPGSMAAGLKGSLQAAVLGAVVGAIVAAVAWMMTGTNLRLFVIIVVSFTIAGSVFGFVSRGVVQAENERRKDSHER